MKAPVNYLLLFVVCTGCNLFSADKKKSAEDSLQYYPATPSQLTKEEFRQYRRALDIFFDTTLLNKNFNGGILVAKNGAVIYEKYTGLADLRKKDLPAGQTGLLTSTTPLHIASTSKTFTAMAVLMMAQENKLSLDDSLNKFFPAFPYPGITVKMLLNHRSGLPNYVYFIPNSKWDKKKMVTNGIVLDIIYKEKPNRSFSPNTHFSYSNTNYVLLASIIEKISGQPFPVYMKQKIFEPLKMNNTHVFTLADTLTPVSSFNYNGTFWANDNLEGTYGDKNVYTTPQDLLKWDQALYTDQLLGKKMLDSAFAPQSFEKPSIHNYGLGWRLQLLPNGKKVVYHFGRWHGFNAAFARLMDEKVTIIILGNRFTRNIYNTAVLSYDIFGDYMQRKNFTEDDSDSPEAPKAVAKPEKKIKKPAAKTKSGSKAKN